VPGSLHHEVLIIGGGLAGLRAAVAAHEAVGDVAVLSRVCPVRSHSGAAQGGANAALGNHPEGHGDERQVHQLLHQRRQRHGGGLAGQRAAQGIRKVDAEGSVALVTAESHVPYERPPLSKGYLMGREGLDAAYLQDDAWYDENGIKLM
jgi:succinate dehydrogenase/fumarate reductase flavoprotein subunit